MFLDHLCWLWELCKSRTMTIHSSQNDASTTNNKQGRILSSKPYKLTLFWGRFHRFTMFHRFTPFSNAFGDGSQGLSSRDHCLDPRSLWGWMGWDFLETGLLDSVDVECFKDFYSKEENSQCGDLELLTPNKLEILEKAAPAKESSKKQESTRVFLLRSSSPHSKWTQESCRPVSVKLWACSHESFLCFRECSTMFDQVQHDLSLVSRVLQLDICCAAWKVHERPPEVAWLVGWSTWFNTRPHLLVSSEESAGWGEKALCASHNEGLREFGLFRQRATSICSAKTLSWINNPPAGSGNVYSANMVCRSNWIPTRDAMARATDRAEYRNWSGGTLACFAFNHCVGVEEE